MLSSTKQKFEVFLNVFQKSKPAARVSCHYLLTVAAPVFKIKGLAGDYSMSLRRRSILVFSPCDATLRFFRRH